MFELKDQEHRLAIDKKAMQRAKNAGICQSLLEISKSFSDSLKQINIKENSYEQFAQIVDAYKNAILPILELYETPDVEVCSSFRAPDTGKECIIFLSYHYNGFILLELDENDSAESVRDITSKEVLRYVSGPEKMLENTILTLIDMAEGRMKVKNSWISPMLQIEDLCKEALTDQASKHGSN